MAEITTKRRNALPDSEFAGPDRSYPVDTRGRQINAKARATQQEEKGKMSASEANHIRAVANKLLAKGK